jgi:hypothetical protein
VSLVKSKRRRELLLREPTIWSKKMKMKMKSGLF